jgi:hypothetical protein
MRDFLRHSRLQNLLRMTGYIEEILVLVNYIIVHQQAKRQFPGLSP